MTDPNPAPFAAFTFTVAIGSTAASPADGAFMEISGISIQLAGEESPGDLSDFVHQLPSVAKHPNLVLKRGYIQLASGLADWATQTVQSTLNTPIFAQDISVSLLGPDGATVTSWTFARAWPVRWETGPFGHDAILTEILEFSYETFQRN
jgi:phage tail-like protein